MIRHLLATGTLLVSATASAVLGAVPSEAYPRCSSLSYGIGSCVNEGWNNGGFQHRSLPVNNGGYLLEQPRFQPGFGRGYSSYSRGNSDDSNWW